MTQISLPGVGPGRKGGRARGPAAHDGNAYPWPCVVLAVDTATRSGWAIRVGGKLAYSGEVDTHDARELDAIIQLAAVGAQPDPTWILPCVLVLERSFPGGFGAIVAALGAARERWLLAWERLGGRRKDVVSVMPASWRSRVLGGRAVRMKRDEIRPHEMAAARQEIAAANDNAIELGPDEAAAILISRWAARAPQVGEKLNARQRKARRRER